MQKNRYFIPTISTLLLLGLAALWVPIDMNAPSVYFRVENFHGIRPRAIIGSILYLLPLKWSQIHLVGNFIKITSAFLWLLFISIGIYQNIFKKTNWEVKLKDLLLYTSLCFIYAASSLTYITFSSSGIIDAFPAAVIAFIITSQYIFDSKAEFTKKVSLVTALLLIAILAHEKSIYDVGILFLWFWLKWGIRKSTILFAPSLIISLGLLIFMADKITSGDSPSGYLHILSSGINYFWTFSFSFWGAVIGGGSFWGLYCITSSSFISSNTRPKIKFDRLITVLAMLLVCFLPLLVALDTSRLCALIWLPTTLVLLEIDIKKVFRSGTMKFILLVFCITQCLIPPSLGYEKGIAPFNCYGLWVAKFLPKRTEVSPQELSPFGLAAHSRPDFIGHLSNKCAQ
jgi:hypothetical protein